MQRIWEPEIVVDESLARRLIRAQFPTIAVDSISLLGTGWDNTAFFVDSKYVFRFPRRQVAVELLQRELSALPTISPVVPLLVPFPQFMGEQSPEFKWPFAGYQYLPGKTACQFALNVQDRSRLAVSIATFLRALHDLDATTGRKAGLDEDKLGKLSLEKWLPRIRQHLEDFRAVGYSLDWNALGDWMARIDRMQPNQGALHVVHGDFYVRHLLLDDAKNLTAVIDWGDVHLSDPAVDLSVIYTFLPPHARTDFLQAYGEVSEFSLYLARMRAIAYGCNLLAYAQDLNDQNLIEESLFMLSNSVDAG
jgi:aminoglycoside phosphotransferase (APT) family kinase protein